MKAVADFTRVNPEGRIRRCLELNRRITRTEECMRHLKDWNINLAQQLVEVPGRILPPERIHFGGRE